MKEKNKEGGGKLDLERARSKALETELNKHYTVYGDTRIDR